MHSQCEPMFVYIERQETLIKMHIVFRNSTFMKVLLLFMNVQFP